MINRLKPKSEFSRSVLTLMTGTTVAQAIPIGISPILTRIYTPEDFGLFTLFIAITSIFGSIANGRYELAIMLPKKEEDAINIFALGFIITFFISLILLVLIILFNDYLTTLLNNEEIGLWLYFVPIAVFFTGLFNILNYFNIRMKYYKDIANAIIIKSIVMSIVQLSIGFIKGGIIGLVSGQLLSQFFSNVRLLKNIIKDKVLISKIKKVKIIALAKRYKDFPKFSMWAILANSLSHHLTNIFISSLHSIVTLGFYSLVQRVLGIPTALIGNAISQVFLQQATKEKQQTGKTINSFSATLIKLTIIGLPIFIILFFIVEDLFALVFGEEWRIAGIYAKVVIPLFFVRFVSSTLSVVLTIFEKQKNELIINLLLIITSISTVIFCSDFLYFLYFFSFFMSLNYLIFLIYYYRLSKGF